MSDEPEIEISEDMVALHALLRRLRVPFREMVGGVMITDEGRRRGWVLDIVRTVDR